MRMLMTVQMDTEAANRGIKDGSLPKIIDSTIKQLQAEAAYFTTRNGQRTAYFIFDMHETAQLPQVAEPFFMGLNAKIDMSPVMNADEVREGLGRLPQT